MNSSHVNERGSAVLYLWNIRSRPTTLVAPNTARISSLPFLASSTSLLFATEPTCCSSIELNIHFNKWNTFFSPACSSFFFRAGDRSLLSFGLLWTNGSAKRTAYCVPSLSPKIPPAPSALSSVLAWPVSSNLSSSSRACSSYRANAVLAAVLRKC